MTKHDINNIQDALSSPSFNTNKPALRELDRLLTVRTFICGYSLSESDEKLWAAIRLNKVAIGIVRRNTFAKVNRWFTHIEATYPALQQAVHSSSKAGKNKDVATNQSNDRYNIKLQDAANGVVTRFPPEPSYVKIKKKNKTTKIKNIKLMHFSGYLHIGHAKAAFLNDYFAHDAFAGSLILRFDDTNPKKEKQEFEDSIKHDLGLLGIEAQRVTYTSDYFPQLYQLCQKLIASGHAYADDTDPEV